MHDNNLANNSQLTNDSIQSLSTSFHSNALEENRNNDVLEENRNNDVLDEQSFNDEEEDRDNKVSINNILRKTALTLFLMLSILSTIFGIMSLGFGICGYYTQDSVCLNFCKTINQSQLNTMGVGVGSLIGGSIGLALSSSLISDNWNSKENETHIANNRNSNFNR